VIEVPDRRPVIVEHQLIAVECGGCGRVTEPAVPAGVSGRVQYGTGVKAAAVYARAAQFLPFARVTALLGDLLGVRVSTGFVHQVVSEAARRLGPFVSHTAALLHADETPARVGGGFKYVHVACTPELTLFHVGGRGKADIDAGQVLPGFTGTLVRDGYAAYRHLTDADHAWCGAHLIRDLRGVHESDPAAQQWAEVMAGTLLMAKKMTEQAVTAGRDALSADEISHIRACYAGALAYGRQQNPPERDGKLSRAGTLVERFAAHRDMILRFTVELAVPFTNNQAERDLRPVKLQQKISATWRTLQGLADFATLLSYLSTSAKHGKDALDVLEQLFTAGPWLPKPAISG
jgi:transposase